MFKNRSVEFIYAQSPLDNNEWNYYVVFKEWGIEINRKFAPWKLDCASTVMLWIESRIIELKMIEEENRND